MSGYLHVLTEGMLIDFIIAKIKVFTTFLTLGWHIILRKVRNWMKQNVWLTEDKFYVDCLPQSSRNLFESVLLLRSLKIRVYFTMVWDNSEYLFGRDFSKDDNWQNTLSQTLQNCWRWWAIPCPPTPCPPGMDLDSGCSIIDNQFINCWFNWNWNSIFNSFCYIPNLVQDIEEGRHRQHSAQTNLKYLLKN